MALLALRAQPAAQGLSFALFERYLDALREQTGIPGLGAAIVQNGTIRWSAGLGFASVATSTRVTEITPFPIADLSQTVAASLVLRECVDRGEAQLDELVQRYSPSFGEPRTTFRQLLSHAGSGGYNFSRARFAGLTDAIEECTDRPYAVTVVTELLDEYAMNRAVPGGDMRCCSVPLFPADKLRTYDDLLQSMAVSYRVDSSRRPTASGYQVPPLDAANGLIASLRDLAQFDKYLDAGVIVRRTTLTDQAWVRQSGSQMGLGWFVQQVNGKKVVWHFGDEPGAASALMIKLPDHQLTLILLANSDGLSAGLPLRNGDVTVSPFAKIFFTLLG
jgi:CubicO group peptidase (beta-lactamase class C family)